MSLALTVQQPRHLTMPDSALFSPTELALPAHLSQSDYSKIGSAITKIDTASEMWVADYALAGMRLFGEDSGLALAADATELSRFHLKKCATVANRFTPEKRFSNFKFSHYRYLMPFPVEFTDRWLPTVSGKKIGSNSLRALAVEAYGSEPSKAKQPKRRNVAIRSELYARLVDHSPSRKVVVLIDLILEDWLKKPLEEQAIVVALAELQREQKKRGSRKRRARRAGSEIKESAKGTADVQYQLEQFYKQQAAAAAKAKEAAVGACPSAGNEPDDAQPSPQASAAPKTPRPTYTERREQQIADGAQSIPQKPPKKYFLKVQWTECLGESFVDTENGAAAFRAAGRDKPTVFWSEKDAIAAEEEHFKQCGFREKVVHCNSCSLKLSSSKRTVHIYHVAHIYSGREHA